MVGIELVRNKSSKEPFAWDEMIGWHVADKARQESVIIRPLGNVVVVMPPLCISSENLAYLMSVIKKSIIAVTCNRV